MKLATLLWMTITWSSFDSGTLYLIFSKTIKEGNRIFKIQFNQFEEERFGVDKGAIGEGDGVHVLYICRSGEKENK